MIGEMIVIAWTLAVSAHLVRQWRNGELNERPESEPQLQLVAVPVEVRHRR